MARRWTAVALPAYALVAGAIALLGLPAVVAIVCVGPLVLFAPGCALVLALAIPERAQLPGRRVVLSVALSIATTALGGLLVNAVAPLTRTSWTIWLVGFTCVLSVVALLRRPALPAAPARQPWPKRSARIPWRGTALGVTAIALIAGAVTLTEISSRNAYEKPLIQMSLVPSPGYGGRVLRLTVSNLYPHEERLMLTIARGRNAKSVTSVVLPASYILTREERVGATGMSASLRRPGQARPFSEVSWIVAPVVGARRGSVHSKRVRRATRILHTKRRLRNESKGRRG